MPNKNSNPFHSPIISIFLENIDGSIGLVPNISFDIIKKNTQCEFNRLEMQDDAFQLFPVGALIVKDLGDIVSFIENNGISSVKILFEDQSVLDCTITSVTYVNNAASNTERKIVSLNLSNSFYEYSQQNSLISLMKTPKPKLFKIDEFIKYASSSILDATFKNSVPTIRVCDKTNNYLLYKPLNPDSENLEYPTDDLFQYMLYASSMAINPASLDLKPNNPKYLFWTEFGNYVNLKYFSQSPEYEYNTVSNTKKKTDTKNFKYAVYDGDAPQQNLKSGEDSSVYKKIYMYRNDPILQFVSKNYYYIRTVPKFLDELSFTNTPFRNRTRGITTGTETIKKEMLKDLAYLHLDDGSKYNVEFIGSNGTLNGITSGAMEIKYDRHWGYYTEHLGQNKNSSNTLLSSEFGLSNPYSKINFMGLCGAMKYVDSQEMWKNMFDFTPVHPNTPNESSGVSTGDFNLQKIIDIRYDVLKGNTFSNPNLETIQRVELENFIMYSLCCMGDQDVEETFFALLDFYILHPLGNNSFGHYKPEYKNIWAYSWKKIQPSVRSEYDTSHVPLNYGIPGYLTGSTFPYMDVFSHSSNQIYDDYVSSSLPYQHYPDSSETPLPRYVPSETWAINLNEQANQQNIYNLSPGWLTQIPSNFYYRPVGVSGITFDRVMGSCSLVVKMHAITFDRLCVKAGVPIWPELKGKKLYYFNATNIVDGGCTG